MTWISRGGPRALMLSLACCYCVQGISKQHWVIGPAQPIAALPGDDVILPCHLLPAMDVSSMTVEWSRRDLKPPYVHVLQDGREMLKEMNPLYRDRTALFTDRLKEGNVSLKLSLVKLSDEGLYRCFLPSLRGQVTESRVQLRVGRLSPPTVSVVAVGNGAVVLRCEARCWRCVPEIEWSREGRGLPADNADHRGNGSVVYRSHVTVLRSATNRFTCKVQVRMFNQTSLAVIEVPDVLLLTRMCFRVAFCSQTWSLLGVLVLVVLAVLCYKRHLKKTSGKSKEPADQPSINTTSETKDRALIVNPLDALTSNTRCDEKAMLCRDEDGGDDKGSIMTREAL